MPGAVARAAVVGGGGCAGRGRRGGGAQAGRHASRCCWAGRHAPGAEEPPAVLCPGAAIPLAVSGQAGQRRQAEGCCKGEVVIRTSGCMKSDTSKISRGRSS